MFLVDLLQGKVTISNDGATIMKLLDIVHPAAKVLVDISMSQDAEVRSPWAPCMLMSQRYYDIPCWQLAEVRSPWAACMLGLQHIL